MTLKKFFGVTGVLVASLGISGYAFLQLPMFGAISSAERLSKSSNYIDGQFQNLQPNPEPTLDAGEQKGWIDMLLATTEGKTPPGSVPVVVTDLHSLDRDTDVVVWLGHSSFFIQLAGKRILIDPVLSKNASPVPMTNEAFKGSSPFDAHDIPDVDYLLISHDHWDHLDYPTMLALKDRIDEVIVGIGVGEHFRAWGFREDQINEAEWETTFNVDDDLALHVLPARHYSGRGLVKNQSLWVSFALESSNSKVFFSGDSGYGSHFKAIGERFGGFDLALLDSGQYDEQWRHVHMMPEDAAQAMEDLNAKVLIPAHIGKFSIAFHSWDDPFKRLMAASRGKDWLLSTPLIGQPVKIQSPDPAPPARWWETLSGAN